MTTVAIFNPARFNKHTGALDALYTLIKAQYADLAQLRNTVCLTRMLHPFVNSQVNGDDLLTANMVLWTALNMSSGVAGALNADSASRMESDAVSDDSGMIPVRAIFGTEYDAASFISRDMLIARVEFIHAAIN